ncbi:MAG: hypothetical protein V7K25_13480 [Nostoc sp.]|uniref:hypothetical protein n=1 Tax=Nostoc sp. TaxID=1180 RepID=UPI002FFA6B0B
MRYITLVTVLRNIGMPAAVNYAQPEQIAYKFLLNGETETGSLTYQQLDVERKAFYVPDSKEPRVKRGLYRSAYGHLVNADSNGAANIGRKSKQNGFTGLSRGCLAQALRIKIH